MPASAGAESTQDAKQDETIYEPNHATGGDWRCSNGRCRERLAKAEVDSPGISQGYVLTGVKRMIVRKGLATGRCVDCGRVHNLGGIFLALAGAQVKKD